MRRVVTCLVASVLLAGTIACGSPAPPTAPAPVDIPSVPTPPKPPPAPVFQAGTWRGRLEFASCTGPATLCSRVPEPFVLRLADDGRGVAQLDLSWSLAEAAAMNVDVTAVNGVTRVAGRTSIELSSVSYSVDLETDLTRFDDRLSGTFRYTLVTGDGQAVKEGRVVAIRVAAPSSRFEGDWVGLAKQTACSGDQCGPIGRAISVRLTMSQAGRVVTGLYNQLAVTGTADGNRLTLAGRYELTEEQCDRNFDGQRCLADVKISATVDALDRLHGTMTYHSIFDDGPRRYSTKRTADLTGIVRWP